jgi:hypothetical protein
MARGWHGRRDLAPYRSEIPGLRPPERLEAAAQEHAQALTAVQGIILSVEPRRRSCCDLESWVLRRRTGLRLVGAAHIVKDGLALLIDKACEQLLRIPKHQCPGKDLRGCV